MPSLALALLVACTRGKDAAGDSASTDTGTPYVPVTRTWETTITAGDYTLLDMDGEGMGVLHGYHMDGQFLGPTLVATLGDTLEITVHNQTPVAIGLHPHGVHYDKDNEGLDLLAEPGGEITYTWEANQGAGTYLYHSHELDGDGHEYQAESGVLGVIVIRDPAEEALYAPDHMINYIMMDTYQASTVPMEEPDTGGDTGGENPPAQVENRTMAVQEVRGEAWTADTLEDLTSHAALGESVRVNIVSFGSRFHTWHIHGYTWEDLATGETLDVIGLGPAESYHFYLPELDNPGMWMVHCHVDDHMDMMTTWLEVE